MMLARFVMSPLKLRHVPQVKKKKKANKQKAVLLVVVDMVSRKAAA